MMLTTKGRYAMMAIVDINHHSTVDNVQHPVSLLAISQRQDITTAYLEQIFARLKSRGIVKSVRGPGGGYILAKNASQITVFDVVSAADEDFKITRCGVNTEIGCMDKGHICTTHHLWNGLYEVIKKYLSSIVIADILDNKTLNLELAI